MTWHIISSGLFRCFNVVCCLTYVSFSNRATLNKMDKWRKFIPWNIYLLFFWFFFITWILTTLCISWRELAVASLSGNKNIEYQTRGYTRYKIISSKHVQASVLLCISGEKSDVIHDDNACRSRTIEDLLPTRNQLKWSLHQNSMVWFSTNHLKIRQISNITAQNPPNQMLRASCCSCLCPIYWNQVLSREWRSGWSCATGDSSTKSD